MNAVTTDVLVVGAGTAGIPCAIEASETTRVLVVEATDSIGGTLAVSVGQMSAAGARRQRAAGIDDDPELHFADVMAISRRAADRDLVRLAVEEAPRTIDWLDDHGFDFDPQTPAIYRGHTPYSRPRTYWGERKGVSILETMRPLWNEAVDDGRLELWRRSRVVALETTDGAVSGAVVSGPQGERAVRAEAVVLASGGYGSNADMFARLTPGQPRLVTNALSSSQGDAIDLATAVGGTLRFADHHTPRLGLIELPPGSGRVDFWTAMLHLTASERPPREIWVNRAGRRFVAEDLEDVTTQEHSVAVQDGAEMWVIFDEHARSQWAWPLVRQWSTADFDREAERGELVQRAWSLRELAAAAGVDADSLVATVNEFNRSVATGHDPLGRTVLLDPLSMAPFYAVRSPAAVLCTFGGVDVDQELRARRADGSTIDGLFVVGEAIGMGATSGHAFCGGMAVTPALGFGRRVGRALSGQI